MRAPSRRSTRSVSSCFPTASRTTGTKTTWTSSRWRKPPNRPTAGSADRHLFRARDPVQVRVADGKHRVVVPCPRPEHAVGRQRLIQQGPDLLRVAYRGDAADLLAGVGQDELGGSAADLARAQPVRDLADV